MLRGSKASPSLEKLDPREPWLSQEGWEECATECATFIPPLGRHIDLWTGYPYRGNKEDSQWIVGPQWVIETFFDYPERVEIEEVRWLV